MKHPYLILAIIFMIIVLLIFDRLDLKNRRIQDGTYMKDRSAGQLPEDTIANDKLILVEAISEDLIKRVVQDFCGWHNREMLQVIPVVTKITDQLFAVTFPYDIHFDLFCFLISFLNSPKGYNRRFHAMGWATTRLTDTWMTEESAGKRVLLFVPDSDTKYDNVFMTTDDQTGYKLVFAGEEVQLLDQPDKQYYMPPVTTEELAGMETLAVDFDIK